MAKRAEFEEKEYEQSLNIQLLNGNHVMWTPGQVFEYFIGIDAALSVYNQKFWNICGYQLPLEGAILKDYSLGRIWKLLGKIKLLPPFQLNLFVQAKRPEFLKGINPHYHPFGITGSYFRFYITNHQQKALEKISIKLGNKALVVYASPTFYEHNDLYHHIEYNSLINASTFVKVSKLKGHSKWVYNKPGCTGLACSDIEYISDKILNEEINDLINSSKETLENNYSEENALNNISFISEVIIEALNEEIQENKNPVAIEYFRRKSIINANVSNKKITQYLDVLLFIEIFNLSWHVILG